MIYRASQGDSKAVIKLLEHGIPADKYKDAVRALVITCPSMHSGTPHAQLARLTDVSAPVTGDLNGVVRCRRC